VRRLMIGGVASVHWQEADDPAPPDGEAAIVRPVAVATCDLDVAVLQGRYPAPGAPYPFGHEGVADVVAVGPEVRAVAPGDRVVVPFQISCGRCAPCRRGRTGNCASHPRLSTYGLGSIGGYEWGGLLADLAVVPHADAMLVPLPAGVDAVSVASASDNLPDAWRAVAPHLADNPGANVLVVGGDDGPNSIGLYAAGIAVALGAGRVVYHDHSPARLGIAAALGAECSEGPPPRKLGAFDITVDASGNEAGLRCVLNSTAFDGTCSSVSVYLEDPRLPLFTMYSRCCTLHIGRAHARPAIPALLDLILAGFNPSLVTSAVLPWDDAAEALQAPPMKLVLSRL
jgi:threonine dehydrogenase-like Zn-dependent dehydrogenase